MTETTHILVTGGAGQVGLELLRAAWPDGVMLHAPSRTELDLTSAASIRAAFEATPFAAVINSAAWTAVDKAESEVAAAFSANALGPALMADATRAWGVPLIQVSTDYVFDGSGIAPWKETDATGPLSVYGRTKLEGEQLVARHCAKHLIFRTSWVYAARGGNFAKTMLRLARERDKLTVIDD